MNKAIILLFIVILLTGCIVIEEDGTDNSTSKKLNFSLNLDKKETVEEPEVSEKPDLEVTKVYWGTLFPETGQEDELTIRIINSGNASVDGFSYKITLYKDYDEWQEEAYEYESSLAPGNTTRFSHAFTFYEAGKFKAETYLDWDNSIKEHDELNNYLQTSPITVSGITQEEPDEEQDTNETSSDGNETESEEEDLLGEEKCVDTDDGINYYQKGRCVDDGPFILGMDDYCRTNFELVELYCTNRTKRCRFAEPYECYCKKGACV